MSEIIQRTSWDDLLEAMLKNILCYARIPGGEEFPAHLTLLDFSRGYVEVREYIKGVPAPGASYIPGESVLRGGSAIRLYPRDIRISSPD